MPAFVGVLNDKDIDDLLAYLSFMKAHKQSQP
jgi:cytochrome c2